MILLQNYSTWVDYMHVPIFYKSLSIDNLSDVQNEVLNITSIDSLLDIASKERGTIHYIHSSEYVFNHSPSLSTFFNKIGLLEHKESILFGWNLVPPGVKSSIHLDSPSSTYSINIPIANYKGTFLHQYKANASGDILDYPVIGKKLNGTFFKPEDCELVETHETTTPWIVNIQLPHQFHNPSKDKYRYTLLCKILKEHTEAHELVKKLVGSPGQF